MPEPAAQSSDGRQLAFIFADQLDTEIASLRALDPARDVVLMAEVRDEADAVPHHRKKITFLFSAMRHFSQALSTSGFTVDYVSLSDPANTHSFGGELRRAVERHKISRVVITEPGEWRVEAMVRQWQDCSAYSASGIAVELLEDDRFLCSRKAFAAWAEGRKQLRMEHFYRWMRQRTGILMQSGQPLGGRWNFDAENRKPPRKGLHFPGPAFFDPDATTCEVLALVERRFAGRFGDLEPFGFAVTRAQALAALDHFISHALEQFGDYQDAMLADEDWLFHSCLSQYMNCGLLRPKEVIAAAERAHAEGGAPLNSVEGFIRQILGWREYVRGIYWLHMPDYAEANALGAQRDLPEFYWSGDTDMRCMAQVIDQTRREAQSHHIQRLMITGNFALLIGVEPRQLCDWYLAVYADAFDWVELPNTLGMVAYADHGLMASKPYAASGQYIDRMSDFCRDCRYRVKERLGDDACPFNYLYWHFIMQHAEKLRGNRRMALVLRQIDAMNEERRAAIHHDAQRFLARLDGYEGADTKETGGEMDENMDGEQA